MKTLRIKIIGLGGIGSHLSNYISRFLNHEKDYSSFISLIDGDYYELKNLARQEFDGSTGMKSDVKMEELKKVYDLINYSSIPSYITDDNISSLIQDGDIIFLCVDNHKTRKIISEHVKEFNDVILISGGNELIDGNVQIYVKKGGKEVTPKITDYHPEILAAQDKLPTEMSCEELQNAEPQLLFTNLMVAALMCQAFYNCIVRQDFTYSEIYFDINTMKALSYKRVLKVA